MNSNTLFMKTSKALTVQAQTKKQYFIEFDQHVYQIELIAKRHAIVINLFLYYLDFYIYLP